MSSTFNEQELLYKLRVNGDPECYTALYDVYVKQIYRFVYFKVSSHEEAEDITSDVFLKAWHYIRADKQVSSFRGLLYRIARNCIIDLYRVRSSKPEARLDDFENLEVGDAGRWYADINNKMDAGAVVAALKKLKQEYREVVTLKYIDGLEVAEIAEIMGKGNIAVRVTLHRAIKKLQSLLPED